MDLREDGEDTVKGCQGLGLGRGKASKEATSDGVVKVKNLSRVRDGAKGDVVPVVMLGKGGWHLGSSYVDDVHQLLLFYHVEGGAEEECRHECCHHHHR